MVPKKLSSKSTGTFFVNRFRHCNFSMRFYPVKTSMTKFIYANLLVISTFWKKEVKQYFSVLTRFWLFYWSAEKYYLRCSKGRAWEIIRSRGVNSPIKIILYLYGLPPIWWLKDPPPPHFFAPPSPIYIFQHSNYDQAPYTVPSYLQSSKQRSSPG